MSGRYEATRYLRVGILTAVTVHAAAAALVIVMPLLLLTSPWGATVPAAKQPMIIVATVAAGGQANREAEPPAAVRTDNNQGPSPSIGEFVQSRIDVVRGESERRSDAENIERLQRLSSQLQHIATPESIERVSSQVQKWLGSESRTAQPVAESTTGEFDHRTAQLHDVRRTETGPDQFAYTTILIDAHGRTSEVPVSVEEGQRLYRIVELIKANPLLERVYRQVVMSLLDRLSQAAEAADRMPP